MGAEQLAWGLNGWHGGWMTAALVSHLIHKEFNSWTHRVRVTWAIYIICWTVWKTGSCYLSPSASLHLKHTMLVQWSGLERHGVTGVYPFRCSWDLREITVSQNGQKRGFSSLISLSTPIYFQSWRTMSLPKENYFLSCLCLFDLLYSIGLYSMTTSHWS